MGREKSLPRYRGRQGHCQRNVQWHRGTGPTSPSGEPGRPVSAFGGHDTSDAESVWDPTHGGARRANLNDRLQTISEEPANQEPTETPAETEPVTTRKRGRAKAKMYWNPHSMAAISYLAKICTHFPAFYVHLRSLRLLLNAFQRAYVRALARKGRHGKGMNPQDLNEFDAHIRKVQEVTQPTILQITIKDEDEFIPY